MPLKLSPKVALFGLTLVAFLPRLDAAIQILAVTHSTNFAIGIAAPGSLATVFCTGLTGVEGVINAAGSPLPRELSGVSLFIDGASVPLLAVADLGSYQQINFQVPWESANSASTLTVSQGQESARAAIVSTNLWPVFFTHPDGSVVAQHGDYELVTRDRPARPGEWIIAYATNLGPVRNTPPTGVAAALDPLSPLSPVPPAKARAFQPIRSSCVGQTSQRTSTRKRRRRTT